MKYAIFGAGILGEQVLIEYWKQIEIKLFFDNYFAGGGIYGWAIEKPKYEKDLFVIVASNKYFEIRKQLKELGYLEFINFVPYQIFRKKVAIVYGNCHIHAVKAYLEQNAGFNLKYGFYPFPAIQNMELLEDYGNVLKHCELFIHQSIRKENKFGERYSSNTMIRFLPNSCQIISIPNLYGMPTCFFPQQKINNSKDRRKQKFFFYSGGDENIEKWIYEGKTLEEIKVYIISGGVYKKEEIIDKWNCFKTKLLEREQEWDIKISDFIFKNYKKEKLFYERLHISNSLVKEISNRLLRYVGCESELLYDLPIELNTHEMFIYQDVMEALELEFEQKYVRKTSKDYLYNKGNMDIDEYLRQAYKWVNRPILNFT